MSDLAFASGRNIRVLGLSGSMRQNSYNTALLRAAQELSPRNMTVELYDLSAIPMYNEDLRVSGYPPIVSQLREDIRTADAILIVTLQ